VFDVVSANDFYKPAYGHIFSAIMSLTNRGDAVDAVTVAQELARLGVMEMVGDPSVLVALQTNVPSTANAIHYANIVAEHGVLRRLITVAGEISDLGFSTPTDVQGTVDLAEQMILEVSEDRAEDSMMEMKDLLVMSLDRIEELSHRGSTMNGLPTGFIDLDKELAGLQRTSLTIIGARPAMGKTSLALGLVAHCGIVLKRPVLMFSLEMSHLELTQRMLASESRVDAKRMSTGQLKDTDWEKVSRAVTRMSAAPIFIDDNPRLTVMDIRARARRLKKQQGDLGLIVIDYLQLMTGRGRAENRQVEVSEISRGLKILARELECPVVALSQLSRGLEARVEKKPMLSDLRESGSLEQDADVVLFLYRPEVYETNPSPEILGMAEVIIAKHRSGPTGSVQLSWLEQYARFDNLGKGI
jgi:replicative DNA helicase